jgi:hypothetical protein
LFEDPDFPEKGQGESSVEQADNLTPDLPTEDDANGDGEDVSME